MTTERTADRNDEPEVEGRFVRFKAGEADQPQPAGGEGAETEGHGIVKIKASDADQPQPGGGEGAETEGHFIKDPEVEGHMPRAYGRAVPPETQETGEAPATPEAETEGAQGGADEAETEGHFVIRFR